jgi:hypothetical protein
MRIATLVTLLFLLGAGIIFLGAGPVRYSEENVTGTSQGNHELDCTVIRPWRNTSGPADYKYPVIGWANGWNFGNVVGEHTTEGYKPGLIEWALDGPYIVVAANQWSVQESDVLACVQWVIDQNDASTAEDGDDSEYIDAVDTTKIGLAGHSQGGGAVIKAGDRELNDHELNRVPITAVIAMNPYGPGWVNPENQGGPVMLLGGTADTTTPPDSYEAVWEAIVSETENSGQGGINAVLYEGTHNSEAWGVDEFGVTLGWEEAQEINFGEYQRVTELWWRIHLNDHTTSERQLNQVLNRVPWIIYETADLD